MTFSRNLTPSNLAYPNISFTETIAGPLPIRFGFRNTIGVIGSFNRGPEGPTLVRNRNEAIYLFGEDDSPGSIFLQQAMFQGATRFVVSRVVPTARTSEATLPLQAPASPSVTEAFVANSTVRRTVGMTFEADYVTPPIREIGAFVTEPVEVKEDSYVATNLEGAGVLQFEVVEMLQATGALTSGTMPGSAVGSFVRKVTDEENLQILSFSLDSQPFLEAFAKPGRFFVFQATAAATVNQVAYNPPSVVTNCIEGVEGKLYLSSSPALVTGQVVYVTSSGTLPTGLSDKRPYWVRLLPGNVITLHTSYIGATGQVITLDKAVYSALGSGTLTLTPNVSKVTQQAHNGSSITADCIHLTNNTLLLGSGDTSPLSWHLATGDRVRVASSNTLPTATPALNTTTDYFVRRTPDGLGVTLHPTQADALANTNAIDITAVGTGVLTLTLQKPVFSTNTVDDRLEILSYPFFEDGLPSVMVKGLTELHSGHFALTVVEPTSLGNIPYFNFRVSYVPTESLLPSDIYPASVGPNGEFINVFRLGRRDRNWQEIKVYGKSNPDDYRLRTLKTTGVWLRFGDQAATDNLDFVPKSKFGIGLAKGKITAGQYVVPGEETTTQVDSLRAFPPGLPAVEVLNQLVKAIRGSAAFAGFIGDVEINSISLPYSFTFASSFAGVDANRIRYRLTRHWIALGALTTDPQDVVIGPPTVAKPGGAFDGVWQRAIDGADPMIYADRILYDANGRPLILIKALSPGSQGNNIRIGIRPVPPGQWRLEVYDDTTTARVKPLPAETFVMNNYSVDPQTGEFRETLDSRMVRCFFLPVVASRGLPINQKFYDLTPQRLAPPIDDVTDALDPKHVSHRGLTFLRNLYLQGGKDPIDYNPDLPQERDIISAIRRVEQEDIAILGLPGVKVQDARYEAAISEIVLQAETSSTINGLRIVVLQAPPNITPSRAQTISDAVLRSDRVVILSGHITMAGYRHLGINRVPADGYYCGTLAMIQPHFSPAAVSVTPGLLGVISNDTLSTPDALDAITRAGLEALHFDPGLRQHKFLNGITTSNDPNKKYISVRRQADQMVMDLAAALQWVRSMPHTFDLRRLVSSSVDAYMRQLLREQKIYAYRPTICDESNNTPLDISRGKMNIKITYTPVFPADFIRMDLVRDLSAEFAITTAAGGS